MATTTTQILFNSPALHSLKRDQLVKLCKIHSIKANGKNSELIERLKQRALELPPEAQHPPSDQDEDDRMDEDADADAPDIPGGMPMDADPPAGNGDYDMQDVVLTSRFSIPRPSEQWEVVMEDIVEVDETMGGTASSKNSLKTVSNGEFGTHTSKCESSLSLSLSGLYVYVYRVWRDAFRFGTGGCVCPPGRCMDTDTSRGRAADEREGKGRFVLGSFMFSSSRSGSTGPVRGGGLLSDRRAPRPSSERGRAHEATGPSTSCAAQIEGCRFAFLFDCVTGANSDQGSFLIWTSVN